jgi:hypothetical protein
VAQRTQTLAVEKLLGRNYDRRTDLQQFVDSASVVVDRAVTAALSIKDITLLPTEQELMERWLAAHFYAAQDPLYTSKSSLGASGSFQRGAGKEGFESTDYGARACNIDYSGMLKAIGARQSAGALWLGGAQSCRSPGFDDVGTL